MPLHVCQNVHMIPEKGVITLNYDYGSCKKCFKQQKFCTCHNSLEIDSNNKDQHFSEHNPQCQSIGEQEQKQEQQQGGLEQEQGPQIQGQNQEGQRQGPQSQEQQQGPQTQGSLSQGQNESQEQVQIQDQTEDQDQTQGPQLQAQRHGDQTMENDQTIDTPIDVDGVTVDVKCGDCKPTIIFKDDFRKEKKKKRRGEDMGKCNCHEIKDECDCNCCARDLGKLLKQVQAFQTTITTPADKSIDIYFTTNGGITNPTEDQEIVEVKECSTVRYKNAGQPLPVPSTTFQLCNVAGISATDTDDTEEVSNVYEFLLTLANQNNQELDEEKCKKKRRDCKNSCCASGIADELECTATFGLQLQVFIEGQVQPLNLTVMKVQGRLVYFLNSANPNQIFVFSVCAITGYRVISQIIGML